MRPNDEKERSPYFRLRRRDEVRGLFSRQRPAASLVRPTKSLTVEWAGYGTRVNCLSPGYMNGPMAGRFFDDPAYGPLWRGMNPLDRPGEPEELCGAAALLASDASSFTTGAEYVVDGGFTCV